MRAGARGRDDDRIKGMKTLMLRLAALTVLVPALSAAQTLRNGVHKYTHADTLRGTNGVGRSWWDATFYDLHVSVNPADSSVRGWNAITYRCCGRRA